MACIVTIKHSGDRTIIRKKIWSNIDSFFYKYIEKVSLNFK
jgi:hypothetical protein